jgi:hypothetical protein
MAKAGVSFETHAEGGIPKSRAVPLLETFDGLIFLRKSNEIRYGWPSNPRWFDCCTGVNFAEDGSAIENDSADGLTKDVLGAFSCQAHCSLSDGHVDVLRR